MIITDPDPCLTDPCDTNADCTRESLTTDNFSCACRLGFTGSGFECSGAYILMSVSVSSHVSIIVPDPCLSTPCNSNAECTRDGLQLNTFTCFCISPYEGDGFNCICKLSTRESAWIIINDCI